MGHPAPKAPDPPLHNRKMPSVKIPLIFIAINIWTIIANAITFTIDPSWMDVLWILFSAGSIPFWMQIHKEIIKKRQEIRKAKYEHWLFHEEWTAPRELDDWAEIERACGFLLEKGVEPTYERALDFLRKEHFKEEYRKPRRPLADHDHQKLQRMQEIVEERQSEQFHIDQAARPIGNLPLLPRPSRSSRIRYY